MSNANPEKMIIEDVLIITMNSARQIFKGTIGIDGKKLGFVGRSTDLPPNWKGVKKIKHPDSCIAMPGFLDGHVHVTYLPWRYDGHAGRERASKAPPKDKLRQIGFTRREAIRAGVTFLADFAPYDDGVTDSGDDSNMLGLKQIKDDMERWGLGGFIRVRLPEEKNMDGKLDIDQSKKHLAEAVDLINTGKDKNPKRLFVHPPIEDKPEYCHETLTSYREVLQEYKNNPLVWVHVHCCENAARARYVKRAFGGRSSIEVLDDYDLLYERTLLAHSIHCSDEDIDLIKRRKARVFTVPKFTDGRLARIATMLDKNIPVALCSDSYAIDPFSRMIHAYHLHRFFDGSKSGSRLLSSLETMEMATIGAARAFGLDNELGSLEQDKRANIVLLDLSLEQFEPFWNPDYWHEKPNVPSVLNNWKYRIEKLIQCGAVSCRDVHTVIADGNVVKPLGSNMQFH